MTNQQPLVRAARCPNCGAPVETTRPGDAMACSFCGSRLERGAGAAAGPISGGDGNELATVYLARTEQLKRVREQLAEVEERLQSLRDMHEDTSERSNLAATDKRPRRSILRGLAGVGLVILFGSALAEGGALCVLGPLLASLAVLGTGLSMRNAAKKQRVALKGALEEIVAEGTLARDERDRLAERAAELEQGLDELGERL